VANYDVFVNKLADLIEGQEMELSLRDLTPGTHKYCYRNVLAKASSDPEMFEDKLLIRFGRGQACARPYSIKILRDMEKIPEQWR